MTKKTGIASGILKPEVMIRMTEERHTILADLPTTIRGFCFHDDEGEPHVVVNARLTWEANRKTYDHEQNHIDRGDMDDPTYIEYGNG